MSNRSNRWGVLGFVTMMILVAAVPVEGLDPGRRVTQYALTIWQARDGLPQETITALAQAPDGALWIGSPSGLIRFDGALFARISLGPIRSPGDRYVTALATAADGTLWITTRDGLFRLRKGNAMRWGREAGLPPGGALGLVVRTDGTVALATERGIVLFDPESERARPVEEGSGVSGSVLTVARGQSGRIWGGAMRGLLQLAAARGEGGDLATAVGHAIVNAVLEDREGRLWVGTSLGMVVFQEGAVVHLPGLGRLDGLWIRCLTEDRDGNVWIGTRGSGAYRWNRYGLEALTTAEGMPDDLVRQIFEDRDGRLWFATAGGLARLADGAVTAWTVREGLPVPFVWSVFGEPDGRLWVGTSGGGIVRLETGAPRRPAFSDPGLEGVEIRSFLRDRDGVLWIGTSGNGLARVRDRHVRWYRWPGRSGAATVYCLHQSPGGTLWVGTGGGLARLDPDGTIRWVEKRSPGPPDVVRSLATDGEGRLWVGTTTGLECLEDGRLVTPAFAKALAGVRIHCILPYGGGTFWMATDAGLVRLKDGVLGIVDERHGLPNQMLYWILPGDGTTVWISSDLGLLRVDLAAAAAILDGQRERLEVLALGRTDGMPSTECNSGFPAGTRRQDGSLCFATTNGVACLDPRRVPELEVPPPVTIDAIVVDGQRVRLESGPGRRKCTIQPGTHRIVIRYGAVSLAGAGRIAYRYRMAGFDDRWVEVGPVREAVFTGLPPGRLLFEVEARRGTGPWSSRRGELLFEVHPAFHQTPLFPVSILLLFVLAAFLVHRVRTARLRARERELAALVDERTEALSRANAELERLAVVDALTGLANRRRFDEALDAAWRQHVRNGRPLALLLVDVDHFKAFNDRYGHPAGDRCLQAIARVLAGRARRAGDVAARYGGEEFVLLLPDTDRETARSLAEALRQEVEALEIPHEASSTAAVVTISVGWTSTVPTAQVRASTLVDAADAALYRAKRTRNATAGPDRS